MDIYTEEEIRHMAISLMNAETDRDLQEVVGASDLSNPCDHCVALALRGIKRESQIAEKTWMGRTIGTAIHSYLEERGVANPALLVGGAGSVEFERKVVIGEIAGYGIVPGHIDWTLLLQLVDVKGSTRKKLALLEDYLQRLGIYRVGLKPRWEHQKRGNYRLDLGSDTYCTLSASKFEEEMEAMAYKLETYFGQLCLYGLARSREGFPPKRLTIMFVNRDGVGTFDVPHMADYVNPERKHDLVAIGFDYSEDKALALMARAQSIFDRLQAGATFDEFPRHDRCFQCSEELARDKRNADVVAISFGEAPLEAVAA